MSRAAEAIDRLLSIMERLRGPGGCPWDREQTLHTLRPYVLEETYEVLEAIDAGDVREHREELGDLLLQIVFQAQLRREEGAFEFADVANAISDKLVSRHPHVFGDAQVKDAEGVLRQWAALKREEKKAKGAGHSVLEGVPREMPALARADRLTEKASRVGFDWPDAAGAREKVREELAELDEAVAGGDGAAIEHELGDALFALANYARKLGIPPEEALRGSVARFIARFEHVERELTRRGVPHGSATLAEMDALWDEAKELERQAKSPGTSPSAGSPRGLGKDGG
ncbi:nucleoside triphosphate pyrophosphohydrolase [Anaeromyxobacter dehalogenans]|uniref:MazG family protein n=1 Tax=Anaeromyxobacter dehalogenans (strain 2CP-C) TaxID=290397 RepID=Q2ILG5_ANADE|nr:nucleoside triphosphate pyrophosphohydrolase [Anaeromyxobacter dehalogenans]ABC82494.1 MazG family protein [Anaeromyxobacter dehalogenans 2CP-C]